MCAHVVGLLHILSGERRCRFRSSVVLLLCVASCPASKGHTTHALSPALCEVPVFMVSDSSLEMLRYVYLSWFISFQGCAVEELRA